MKTAISIPDSLFYAADDLAQRIGLSRSDLYARAVAAYLEQHRAEGVTERLNRVYAEDSSDLDPAFAAAQQELLADEEW